MSETTKSLNRFGPPTRGVTSSDVERAADALLRGGQRPTIDKIREKLGTGSPNTINPLLDTWWKKLSARLDAGPAALHRLPESVAHVAEAFWIQALDVRSHVLSLREGELESRLRDRERNQATLEAQLQELTLLLRKEQATRESQARGIAALEAELTARPQPPARPPRRQSS